jgi:hypothetical protein
LSAGQAAQGAAIAFALVEDADSNTLTTTLPGAVVIALGPEKWSIDILATGISALDAILWPIIVDRVWVDDDPGFINRVSYLDATHLLAESDIPLAGYTPNLPHSYCGYGAPMPLGALGVVRRRQRTA